MNRPRVKAINNRKKAVILFTRVPVPGKTKTRMMPYLTAEGCASLHKCFLRDMSREIIKTGADLFVCYESDGDISVLRDICGRRAKYFPQRGADLGTRMFSAISEVLMRGYETCVLTGSDIPELTKEDIEKAFEIIESCDVVIGPSSDGGYYLIGMKQPLDYVFDGKSYGHGNVLEDLEASLSTHGSSYGMTAEHCDMDTREDLAGYRERMRSDRQLRQSSTGRFLADNMSISVIVPVYNESSTIEKLIVQLDRVKDDCEIIFVDGGSTDGTAAMIPDSYTLINGPKGRALQMNAGSDASTGDILFFLHCDSELPDDALGEIRRVMSEHEAGFFGIAFHSRQFFMWTNRVISNHRALHRRIMFGDQGIFLTRELFERVGKFPEIPLMEDYQISLSLKSMGVKPGMCRHRIYTSERRYPKKTIPKLKVMWMMARLRKQYRDGVPIEEIARQYKDIR